jgi:hypothetical protein
MGIKERNGNYTLQKNNSIEDLVGKQENGYLDSDPNKTMINVTNEFNDAHKKIPQRGNHGRNEKLMEKTLVMVNKKVQDGSYQRIFLHLLRLSSGFCLCFC